jgi:hypothetical protein
MRSLKQAFGMVCLCAAIVILSTLSACGGGEEPIQQKGVVLDCWDKHGRVCAYAAPPVDCGGGIRCQ